MVSLSPGAAPSGQMHVEQVPQPFAGVLAGAGVFNLAGGIEGGIEGVLDAAHVDHPEKVFYWVLSLGKEQSVKAVAL